jgi:AcrR family transcriptional regulator
MLLPSKPKNAATVQRILTAAETLFLERNYADVTVSQVAAAAALTKGAVYHYFPSKEKLYLGMLYSDFEEKIRLYRRQAIELEGSCADRLRHLTGAFLSLPERKRNLIGLVRRDSDIFPPKIRAELIHAYQRALPDLVEEILRDGIRDGEIIPCDPRLLAWHFVATVEVLLTPDADQRFACDDDKLNYVLALFLGGCSRKKSKGGES